MGMSDATNTSKTQTKNVNCLYMLLDGGLFIKCLSSRDSCPLLVSDDLVVRVALRSIRAVERGLSELRKLGIEQQLWEASRKGIDQPSSLAVANHKPATDSDASS